MHKKYAKDGLQVVSVSLDPLEGTDQEKKETLERVLKFLRAKGATFPNLLLNDNVDRPEKFHFAAPPCYFVFTRKGTWHQFRGDDGDINYADMDRLVVDLLREK